MVLDAKPGLADGELACLAVLWQAREVENIHALRLSEIHDRIRERCRQDRVPAPAKTTVSTFLRTLTRKGYLQETTLPPRARGPAGTPAAAAGPAPRPAPATRSPRTGYCVVVEPGAVLREGLDRLVACLPPSWRDRAVSGFEGAVQALADADGLRRVEQWLDDARAALGACSCTFYARDPWWPDEYRLVFMPGVKYPETMHGFNIPEEARRMITAEWSSPFVSDVQAAGWTESDLAIRSQELVLSPEQAPLFARFASREGHRSCARLQHRDSHGVRAVLFVNFARPTTFEPGLRERIRGVMAGLVERLPLLDAELRRLATGSVAQVMRILQPIHRLANLDRQGQDVSLRDVLELVLGGCLEAFGIHEDNGLGTIHLFEPETRTLVLAAAGGRIDDLERTRRQSVSRGEGIIAWVALNRRPLLITDLETSAFRGLHVVIRQGIRSQMTAPLLAGKDVVGVINLESVHRAAFSPEHLRLLCHAALRAATAYRLRSELASCRERLALVQRFVHTPAPRSAAAAGPTPPAGLKLPWIKPFAETACQSLKAAICDVWRAVQDAKGHLRFDLVEATDACISRSHGRPRPHGWTDFVCRQRLKVWITNVQGEDLFDAFYWNDELKTWKTFPPDSQVPRTVSGRLIDLQVHSELGIPFLTPDRHCLGVAWLKYDVKTAAPTSRTMELAESVADVASFVWYQGDEGAKAMPSEETVILADQFAEEAARRLAP